MIDYQRVAEALNYIKDHAKEQPQLEEVAQAVHLSPYHFHRMFKEWAGVTPKNFLQYISLDYAKKLLNEDKTIEEATFDTGLSSSSRLHDLFVNIEGMTPGEYKNNGQALTISYHFSKTLFGDMLVASTGKGLSNLMFVENRETGLQTLHNTWTHAEFTERKDIHIENMEKIFTHSGENLNEIKLHIQGTDFQLKVWEALLKIPSGQLVAYSDVAGAIGNPRASRAVGTALANNPIAYLIPCHRVIKKVGGIGEYRWGSTRKTAIIGWEAAQVSHD